MNAGDGSNQTRLTNNPRADWQASWFPDGRLVFTSNRNGTADLLVLDHDFSIVPLLADLFDNERRPDVTHGRQ